MTIKSAFDEYVIRLMQLGIERALAHGLVQLKTVSLGAAVQAHVTEIP